ncbi:hypothetical protein N7492_002043 [Penicillium capsulatum]|uniref:Involucrin repeat protein n=1 Tax=Penicillium capsulatum TaxID=69766 RepID=A0A9W9IIQ1_9EURO|nr:hypothetical protein N7492_002043 [Penicillium capsulatum]KAJ6123337.1 hypothetical protein N7512_005802 [Penicillium capsulatum]
MFKALMGGGRSSSDVRSTSSSSSKSSRRKADSKSTSSRKSSRGDDRDRGLGDLSAYPSSASGSKRGPPSTAADSVASFMTAEPESIDNPDRIVERVPKRRDSDRDSKSSRRRDRDRSESRDRDRRRSSRRSTTDSVDDLDRERDRRERRRTQSGDVPASNTPGAQFAADIAAPGFSQFPMQYDNPMPPASFSPGHDSPHDHESSPSPYDPHVQQQFPGQFPAETAQPYFPPNPAGAAADYYGDQGQSVQHQPGVRVDKPLVIPNSQPHLMAASPSANPPPEPSSVGQVGAAAAYFDEVDEPVESPAKPPSEPSSRPPKPSKPSSGAIPAAGAAAATYGIGSLMSSHEDEESSMTGTQHYSSHQQLPAAYPSKPPHSYGVGAGVGAGAAAAAAGYMMGHHHHSSSPTNSHYTHQNYEHSSQAGAPSYATNDAMLAGAGGDYAPHAAHVHNPGFYPHGTGSLAVRQRPRGPLSRFADFWRDPEGVGRFEDYTETIGVCKYCFQPGTSSLDAPRKHHYHRRRHSADRYSSSGSSRISKLNRYQSSEDEGRHRKRSKKSSSWLPGMLAGSLFAGKEFNDSYSVRSGRVAGDRSSYDGETGSHSDRRSYTSRGVIHRSGRSSPRESRSDHKRHQTRSRSRSSSRSRHSFVKEAALGAAVGGAALAASKSRQRTRSRSPSRVQSGKDSSSSSSFVDVSRPAPRSLGGLTSFFTSSSENRKKKSKPAKKRRGLFSFNSSSSSSLDADLAFGSGFSKKPKPKQKKGKKGEDVDAALLGLGATATALAAASHGRSRSTGQILTAKEHRSRHSNYASSANEDEEWVDAESEDQSGSSVSSALAFGASSAESGSDSNSGGWSWGWGSKKKKDRKSSAGKAAAAAGAGVLGGAALASVARNRDSRVSSSDGSLKHVYPVPTSDPSRYDATTMSPSVYSGGQPPLVRPGPIPLQQPQPVTPVSQSVYTTQAGLPGSIPAYNAPAVPPIFANDYSQYGAQPQGSRDARLPDDAGFDRRKPRRSDSSPVFPTQASYVSSLKRRSTSKDQASVSFDLTEEQAERERRLDRRSKKSREEVRDEPLQLIDREEEQARRDSERRDRDRRRREREDEQRHDAEKDKESTFSWAETAAVGAIGAAAASSLASRKSDDKLSEMSSRRERRRAERSRNTPIVFQPETPEHIEDVVAPEVTDDRETRSLPRSPRPAPVYEDYAEFYAPKELRHSPDEHARTGSSHDEPNIIEVVPASEREPKPDRESYDDLPQFAQEPYENRDHLPWPVPRLHFIQPTPPQSVNGSVRGASSPVVPPIPVPEEPAEEVEEDVKERERPSAGSRVSWGEHSTHEYEVPSSSEQEDVSPFEDSPKELSIGPTEEAKSKEINSKPDFGNDVEFAATIAAGAAAAGFDPSMITDDPKYHTRTSPPGSEDEGTFSHSQWDPREEPHGFVEGEVGSYDPDQSPDVKSSEYVIDEKPFVAEPEAIIQDREISPTDRRERSSIAQEVIEQLNGKHRQPEYPDNDVFSMPGGFDTADNSREISESRDDTRSVFSAPVGKERDSTSRSRKSRRSGDDFESYRDIKSQPAGDADADDDKQKRRTHRPRRDDDTFSVDDDARSAITEIEDREDADKSERRRRRSKRESDTFSVDDDVRSAITEIEDREDADKSERRRRRSKRESDTFSVDDDVRSAITDIGDRDRSERRKHRSRSSRDKDLDDAASITSSPARIDETRDKRRSKDDKEKDKSSGSFLRNIFGSRVSAPESHSRSSSLDKRSSREAISEAGVDDERRRRKKRSSKHRSSSGGDKLDDGSDKDSVHRDDKDLEEYRSSRQRKEEQRRRKYEDIVDSGRRRESEKV